MYEKPFIFKINDNGTGPNLLLQVCLERGWQEHTEENTPKDRWNIWWRTSGFSLSQYRTLRGWQFTNHVPRGSCICKKDNLSRYLKVMKNTYGNIYDFSPEAFILPLDYSKLVEHCSRIKLQTDSNNNLVWICKPVGQSQGRGISLFRNPLTVYVYREGLARFSTNKFSMKDITNKYAHLTNCAINKQGPGYLEMKDKVGAGCKWTLRQLRHYLNQNGIDDWLVWQRIASLIVLTIASQIGGIPTSKNCFEFYGFDILLDQDLKPWLLEVNLSPALGTDCDIDPAVKKPMLHDLFDLLGLPVCNTGLCLFESISRMPVGDETDDFSDDDFQPINSAKTAANVVAMACKWKNHLSTQNLRKGRFKTKPLRSKNNRITLSQEEKQIRRHHHVPIKNISSYTAYHKDNSRMKTKSDSDDSSCCQLDENQPGYKWGNGVDWRCSLKESGDWVRVYPLLVKEHCGWRRHPNSVKEGRVKDHEVRLVVGNLSRLSKMVKEVFTANEGSPDEKKDSMLIGDYLAIDAVWHPAPGFHEENS
nr:probable tubulin polyglutamylase TTLL2 isoform X2 [Halyomorpha halys]